MDVTKSLKSLADRDLVAKLDALAVSDRELSARIVVHLAEVEERRLHLDMGYSSLFRYCVERLGFSEDVAYKRIRAARLAGTCPQAIEALAAGRVSLSALNRLAPHMEDGGEELLSAAEGKSTREVEKLVAERFCNSPRDHLSKPRPIGKGAYRLDLVVSQEFVDKLERVQALSRHRLPDGDAVKILEEGLALVLEKTEEKRFAVVKKPRARAPRATKVVPAAVRREVYERDRGCCAWTSQDGKRCGETAFLEFDHVQPRARGGGHETENGRLLCRAHNRRSAELAFGQRHMTRAMEKAQHERDLRSALTNLGWTVSQARRAIDYALGHVKPAANFDEAMRVALRALAP